MDEIADKLARLQLQLEASNYEHETYIKYSTEAPNKINFDDVANYIKHLQGVEMSARELLAGRARNAERLRESLSSLDDFRGEMYAKED